MIIPNPEPVPVEYPSWERYEKFLQLLATKPDFDFFGNLDILDATGVGFTGSRQTSQQSCGRIHELAAALGEYGALIISGGARGTDEAAHRGALSDSNGRTLVLPPLSLEDPDIPKRYIFALQPEFLSRVLFLSSFDIDDTHYKTMPLIRNELIALFSGACIIGQTGMKGGTISTVNHCRRFQTPLYFPEPDRSASNAWKDAATHLSSFAKPLNWQTDSELKAVALEILDHAKQTIDQRVSSARNQLDLFPS